MKEQNLRCLQIKLMNILVTGSAGFIGYHLCLKLLENKFKVFGIDNLNAYYDLALKKARNTNLKKNKNFIFFKIDLSEKNKIGEIKKKNKIKYIIHLAAQAGVRYSVQNPEVYFKSNIEGFFNVLDLSKKYKIKHLIHASSSSVYGNNKNLPLKENYNTDQPQSFYAATKKSNEVMAHSYSNIYQLPITSLRFFTVYGPYGRPDMAIFKFTKLILENKTLSIFNHGKHSRDFTYIDDVIKGINSIIMKPPRKKIPYNCFNIGNGKSRKLKDYLFYIEKFIQKKSKSKKIGLQKGDVKNTHADISLLNKFSSYSPKTEIKDGVKLFVDWYKGYYKVKKNEKK